jgi:hypothetical protein
MTEMQTARATEEADPAPLAAGLFSSSDETSAGRTQFRQSRKNTVNPKNFFAELQRRNVYKIAVAYGVVSWLIIQIATQVFPFFDIPNWVTRMVVILLLLGFPVALVLAWAYELTPEGLKLTDEVDPEKSITRSTARKLDFIIIGVLLAVIGVFAYQRFGPPGALQPEGASKKSIAVLPFIDLSQNKDQEYFSDGISEQIINALAKIHGLAVVARTSAFVFKNKSGRDRIPIRNRKIAAGGNASQGHALPAHTVSGLSAGEDRSIAEFQDFAAACKVIPS